MQWRPDVADKVLAFLGLLADLGYIGLHSDVITGYKRKRGEKELPEVKKAANRLQASLRCIGERANAQLKCWRVLTCDFRGQPPPTHRDRQGRANPAVPDP
jgi:hypothetical protein